MKTALTSILASIAVVLTAAASPSLRIDMTIATSGDRVVSRPSFVVESGKPGGFASGDDESELRCALTPTLLDDGAADIQMVITQRKGKKTDRHAPRIRVPLGKLAKLKVGELVVTVKPSLAR